MVGCQEWEGSRLGVIFSIASLPEISEFLVKLCDDDWLARGRDDHLHVSLALPHLPGSLLTGAGRLKYFNILRLQTGNKIRYLEFNIPLYSFLILRF